VLVLVLVHAQPQIVGEGHYSVFVYRSEWPFLGPASRLNSQV